MYQTRILVIISILLLIYNCSGYEYVSTPHYIPLNTKKGDLKTNISFNNVQLGYSFANHYSIFATGSFRDTGIFVLENGDGSKVHLFNTNDNSGEDYHDDVSYEINAGGSYFNKYKIFVFELLGGTGYGELYYKHTRDLVNDYKFTLHTERYNIYIQPNAGMLLGDHVALGISAKISGYICYNIKTEIVPGDIQDNVSSDSYFIGKRNANMYFFEPAFTFRFGFKNFKFQSQIMQVVNFTPNQIRYRDKCWFLSLSMNLDCLKGNKDNSKQEK